MKKVLVSCFILFSLSTLLAQEVDEAGALKFYPDQEESAHSDQLLQYGYGVSIDLKPLANGTGIFLGLQGSFYHLNGWDWGLMAKFLINQGINISVYPYTTYGYGYAGVWMGYGFMLGNQWRITPKLNLAMGGLTSSAGSTNTGGGTIQGSAMLLPELLVQYYFVATFSIGLSLKYNVILGDVPQAGIDPADMQGMSVGLEFNFSSGK